VVVLLHLWYGFNIEAAGHNHNSYDLYMNFLIQNKVPLSKNGNTSRE
jgi:hypothetical protein